MKILRLFKLSNFVYQKINFKNLIFKLISYFYLLIYQTLISRKNILVCCHILISDILIIMDMQPWNIYMVC